MSARANLYEFGQSGIGGLYERAVCTAIRLLSPQSGACRSDELGRAEAKAPREAREGEKEKEERKGKRKAGAERKAGEKRAGSVAWWCLKNRQIVTVSLTMHAVLIKCLQIDRSKMA